MQYPIDNVEREGPDHSTIMASAALLKVADARIVLVLLYEDCSKVVTSRTQRGDQEEEEKRRNMVVDSRRM